MDCSIQDSATLEGQDGVEGKQADETCKRNAGVSVVHDTGGD